MRPRAVTAALFVAAGAAPLRRHDTELNVPHADLHANVDKPAEDASTIPLPEYRGREATPRISQSGALQPPADVVALTGDANANHPSSAEASEGGWWFDPASALAASHAGMHHMSPDALSASA